MSIPRGRVRIEYAGKDITKDVSDHLLSFTYTDKVEGSSDELALELEDVDGLWRTTWYPKKGDKLRAWVGDDSGMIACGTFEVDQPRYKGPGIITLGALAAGPTASVRTSRYVAYTNQTLRQIVMAAAARNGFTVAGTIPNVALARLTQDNKSDLTFLAELAQDYGLVFSLRGGQLVFSDLEALESADAAFTLALTDLQPDYEFTDNLVGSYSSCEVSYHIPKSKKKSQHIVQVKDGEVTSGNVLKLHKRVENDHQAELLAKAALHRANSMTLQAHITTVEGDRRVLAGVNFNLAEAGVFSRKWHILESTHTVDKAGGYAVSAQLKGVS